MSHASNISLPSHWEPSGSLSVLTKRAELLAQIRHFFAKRHLLEVDTPIMGTTTSTDPHLHSFSVQDPHQNHRYYLQTSPEFFMKRLLAAGSGSIYQISKAFRAEEIGHLHRPEFTLLEWYRVDFDHHQLIEEVGALLQETLGIAHWEKHSYHAVFEDTLGLNPHTSPVNALKKHAIQQSIDVTNLNITERDGWLDLLFSHVIQPTLGHQCPVFIYNYPASQALLACLDPCYDPPVAQRFELFIQGIELANGSHELTDPREQRQRFEHDLKRRQQMGHPCPPIDEELLQSLAHGLPKCAGVALGLDRLLMLLTNRSFIHQVNSF